MTSEIELPMWSKFVIGAFGGATGWLPIHPIDVIKVRAQINTGKPVGPVELLSQIWQTEGLKGLYAGITAALTRQFTYGTIRLGLYDVLRDTISAPGTAPSLGLKFVCGLTAGGIAAAVCNPVEVALVRMQADGAKPKKKRRGYRNVVDAWVSIAREEGVATLYR